MKASRKSPWFRSRLLRAQDNAYPVALKILRSADSAMAVVRRFNQARRTNKLQETWQGSIIITITIITTIFPMDKVHQRVRTAVCGQLALPLMHFVHWENS